ncbi:hypothetical protein ACVGVM_29530 (plasmid) [Pseudonocardia bannensis]|uniref:Uncharacterized protein n=1 Tax=Pseudonocardia bannensis TaxID=630973 RepID=A0A848DQD0_9PSEU|nr:hypothetical protein [Pseudonocardia bannensis]NMH94918.1 hypothetical protein [Pseudonocardia bannensis]
MGGNSRYDRDRPVGDREAAEARAFPAIAELLAHRPELITDRAVAGQVAHVLHDSAIELDADRPLPIGVRRAVRGLAAALRAAMDPRPKP